MAIQPIISIGKNLLDVFRAFPESSKALIEYHEACFAAPLRFRRRNAN